MPTVEQRHLDPHPPSRRGNENRAAIGLGIAGIVVAGATFVVPGAAADAWWTAGSALVFLALVMVAVGVVHARGERLSVLPTSAAGWAALVCSVGGAALIPTPVGEISLLLGAVAAALAVGAVAARRERSLPVIMLPLLAGTFVLAFLLGELLIGHE